MTIVAVNGGGNTPKGADALPPPSAFVFTTMTAGLSQDAPPTDYSYDKYDNLSPADDSFRFSVTDYKPTVEADDNYFIIDGRQIGDGFEIDTNADLSDLYCADVVPTEVILTDTIHQVSIVQDL